MRHHHVFMCKVPGVGGTAAQTLKVTGWWTTNLWYQVTHSWEIGPSNVDFPGFAPCALPNARPMWCPTHHLHCSTSLHLNIIHPIMLQSNVLLPGKPKIYE